MPIGIFFGSARRPSTDPQRVHGKIISYYQKGASYIVSMQEHSSQTKNNPMVHCIVHTSMYVYTRYTHLMTDKIILLKRVSMETTGLYEKHGCIHYQADFTIRYTCVAQATS